MIHEWRIFVHLYKNLFMKKLIVRQSYAIYDRRLVGACKQPALMQMRNVLLDLEGQIQTKLQFRRRVSNEAAPMLLLRKPFRVVIALVRVKTSIAANTLIPPLNRCNINNRSLLYLTCLKKSEFVRYTNLVNRSSGKRLKVKRIIYFAIRKQALTAVRRARFKFQNDLVNN